MASENNPSKGGIGGDSENSGNIDLSAVKKRGRPPGSKNKSNSDAEKHSPGSAPMSDVDAAFVAESCVLLLESTDEIIAKTLVEKLAKVAPERAQDFRDLQSKVGLNDKDRAMLRASVTAIVKKYAILGRFGPEILLLVFIAQYSYRQLKLSAFVTEICDAKNGKKSEQKVTQEKPMDKTKYPDPVGSVV